MAHRDPVEAFFNRHHNKRDLPARRADEDQVERYYRILEEQRAKAAATERRRNRGK